MTASIISVRGLTKSFRRKPVLQDLDLELAPGEVTVLLGANGAGKSTLLKLCIGLLKPNRGEVRVLGLDPIKQQGKLLRRVGYVPDVPDVYDWMKPRDLYRFLKPHYPTWDQDYCDHLCAQLDIPHDTKFGQMSRGQGMKTMLTAALAPKPELLLLDEPFGGLDPLVRDEVLHGVIGALRDEKVSVLCSTHELELASLLADRVAVMAQGRIERYDEVEKVAEPVAPLPSGLKNALRDAQGSRVGSC